MRLAFAWKRKGKGMKKTGDEGNSEDALGKPWAPIGQRVARRPESKPRGKRSAIAPPSASTHIDMDIRKPFSKLKKKIKHRLTSNKHKSSGTETDAGGERVDATGSLPRLEPHVVVGGGHDQEGSGATAVGGHVFSTNQPPQPDDPEPVPACGSGDDQGGEADIDGKKDGQRYLAGSGSHQEGDGADEEKVEQVRPSPSTPSLVPGGNPDGMRMRLSQLLPLIIPLDSTNASTVPGHAPEVIHPNESAEPSAAVDMKKSDWKSTASATAKFLLRGVRDSADAFGPLKSVASGLCFILENYEVQPSLQIYYPRHLQVVQRTKANSQAIEVLAPRVKALTELLCAPVSEGDIREELRRKILEQ
jgi:hypothetical protein